MSLRCTTPVERTAFFRALPEDEFSELEIRTRDVLLEWLTLKPTKSFPLMEWIDRRLGGEIATLKDEGGQGELRLQPASGPPAAAAEMTPDEFFASLPDGCFSPEEDSLREAIFDFLAGWRSQELAHLGNLKTDMNVKQKAAAFMRAGVQLEEWLQRRIGGEVELKLDRKSGNKVIHLTALARPIVTAKFQAMQAKDSGGGAGAAQKSGAPVAERAAAPAGGKGSKAGGKAAGGKAAGGKPKVVGKEEWFADLPDNALSSDEAALRQALLDWLKGGKAPVMFMEAGSDVEIQRCRAALLPASVPLREWIERRVGGEIELRKDPSSGQTEVVIRGSEPAVQAGKAGGKGVAGKASGKGKKGADDRQGKNAEAAQEEFFNSLPDGELTPEELDLRQGILNLIDLRNAEGAPLLLADAAKDSEVSTAREALLPTDVNLRMWIERRIGGELEVTRDDRGQYCICMRGAEGAAGGSGGERQPRNESFFDNLPEDKFLPEEERLREALLGFLDNFQGPGPATLTHAGVDPEVRRCRLAALPQEAQVSLKKWIERRMGGEVEMVTDANGQFVLGHKGTLDPELVKAESESRKRPRDDDDRGGKGKGKRSGGKGGAAPWSRRDDDDRYGRGGPRPRR